MHRCVRSLDSPRPRPNVRDVCLGAVTSIYELIRDQVERAPDAPLDLDVFPDIPLGPGSELTVIAGLHDHIATGPNREPSEIVDAIRRAIDGRCSWRELEVELDQTSMVRQFDLVAQQLGRDGLTSQATAGFRELARSSRSCEAVKWSVALGYIDAAAGGRLEPPTSTSCSTWPAIRS